MRLSGLAPMRQNEEDFFAIRCKRCLMPNTAWEWNDPQGESCDYCRPLAQAPIAFPDDMGNENADLVIDDIKTVVTAGKKPPHDCLVSLTGGRDSSFTLHYVKNVLGLNPLAFNFHTGFMTAIAQRNMERVTKALGLDFVQIRLDWRFQKKLARGFLLANGEVCSVCHQGYFYAVQMIARWTGLKYILRGLSKVTEGHRRLADYVDWYCLSDESFNSMVDSFAADVGITERELEDHADYMHLRRWTDKEVRRIDIPDMLDYGHQEIVRVLEELGWERGRQFIHSDCLFAPILVCCQRLAQGYSKKQVNVSNLLLADLDLQEARELLLSEENIDFDNIEHLTDFLELIGVDESGFEDSVRQNWAQRE